MPMHWGYYRQGSYLLCPCVFGLGLIKQTRGRFEKRGNGWGTTAWGLLVLFSSKKEASQTNNKGKRKNRKGSAGISAWWLRQHITYGK